MTRFWRVTVGLIILLVAAACENEPEAGWKKIILPANDGFGLSMQIPPGWEYNYSGAIITQYGSTDKTLYVFVYDSDVDSVSITAVNVAEPMSLDEFAKREYLIADNERELKAGRDKSFGRPSFTKTSSYETGSKDPFYVNAITVFYDRIGVHARFAKHYELEFSEQRKTFDKIIKSIKVNRVPDRELAQISQLYVSPDAEFTAGKYFLGGHFSIVLPPGWLAEEVKIADARSEDDGAGRMIIDFFPPGSDGQISATMHMEGATYATRRTAAEMFATREAIIEFMAPNAREVETEANLVMPPDDELVSGTRINQDSFCLSESHTRRFHQTNHVEVKTYLGKDALTGKDVKLRVYTGGGITLACSLIIRAPPDKFDRLAPDIDQMVSSIKTEAGGLIQLK